MALSCRLLYRNCNYIQCITKPVKWNVVKNHSIRNLSTSVYYPNSLIHRPLTTVKHLSATPNVRLCHTQGNTNKTDKPQEPEQKPGLVQRFKDMYRDYWYVLLPVHCATSAIWFGSFYYTVRSGVDVLGILESIGVSETLLSPLRQSSAGYFALAFALYKLVTPLRYAVTVGGTTYAIRRLTNIGWIKPVPSRERIKEMLQEKKDTLQDRFKESKQHYQIQMKEKRSQMMDEMRRYKTEMRNLKNKVKKM